MGFPRAWDALVHELREQMQNLRETQLEHLGLRTAFGVLRPKPHLERHPHEILHVSCAERRTGCKSC